MTTNSEELLRKLSDMIMEMYNPDLAEVFTEFFEDLVSHIKDASNKYWDLVKSLRRVRRSATRNVVQGSRRNTT